MKNKYILLVVSLIIIASFLTACGGTSATTEESTCERVNASITYAVTGGWVYNQSYGDTVMLGNSSVNETCNITTQDMSGRDVETAKSDYEASMKQTYGELSEPVMVACGDLEFAKYTFGKGNKHDSNMSYDIYLHVSDMVLVYVENVYAGDAPSGKVADILNTMRYEYEQ